MSENPVKTKINRNLLSLILVVLVAIIWIGMRLAFPDVATIFAGTAPNNLGVKAGKLAPCPSSPNCVSSQTTDHEHYIKPFTPTHLETAIADLKKIIDNQPRTKIITATDNYLYVEFSTPLMGFVDDVEFYLNQEAGMIEVRSASRLGESDLGVNRQRLENIRNQFNQVYSQTATSHDPT